MDKDVLKRVDLKFRSRWLLKFLWFGFREQCYMRFSLWGSVHICPVEATALTLMISRAAMVLCASSNSQLSCETRVSRYFLSLLRLSDCKHTHNHCEVAVNLRTHIRSLLFPLLVSYLRAGNLTAMWRCSPSRLLACLVPEWVSRRLQDKEKH